MSFVFRYQIAFDAMQPAFLASQERLEAQRLQLEYQHRTARLQHLREVYATFSREGPGALDFVRLEHNPWLQLSPVETALLVREAEQRCQEQARRSSRHP